MKSTESMWKSDENPFFQGKIKGIAEALTSVPDQSRTDNLWLRSLIDFLTKSSLNPFPNLHLHQKIVDAEAKSCPNLAQMLCMLIKSWQHLPANNKAVIMALLSIDK